LLYSLPTNLGGLNINIPSKTADIAYFNSRKATKLLTDSLLKQSEFSITDHNNLVQLTKNEFHIFNLQKNNATFTALLNQFDPLKQRSILRAKNSLSAWLNAIPVRKDHFDLNANEFRDALCLRYMKPLLNLPSFCDGCGQPFTTSHALDCRKGGLVVQRHNEIRDIICDLSSLAWNQVTREPVIQDQSDNPPQDALVADFKARGVWQPQATALFDVRVIDSDAPSYLNLSPSHVLKIAERDKKNKYNLACEGRHATFTPLCMTVDGLLGDECKSFLKHLSDFLSTKWEKPYHITYSWVKTKISFSLIRATNLCIRGSRFKWRGLNHEDSSGIITHHLN
jgi:hypothetical protein